MEEFCEEKEGVSHNRYNPCYYLEMVAKGILWCLGFDSASAQEGKGKRNADDTPSTTEQEMESTEDDTGRFWFRSIALRFRGRVPVKPPVGTGTPPGINSISS